MVLGLNPATNDTLNLPGIGCYEVVSTPRFGSAWRVPKAWPWKVPRLSQKKKKKEAPNPKILSPTPLYRPINP